MIALGVAFFIHQNCMSCLPRAVYAGKYLLYLTESIIISSYLTKKSNFVIIKAKPIMT